MILTKHVIGVDYMYMLSHFISSASRKAAELF